MFLDSCSQLSKAVGEEFTREDLVVAFVRLLKDNEAEVRTAASGQVPGTITCCAFQDALCNSYEDTRLFTSTDCSC